VFNTLLVQPLFNLLVLIYAIIPGHDLGVAVIILTILVRILIWPLVTRQLRSQAAMQKLAPDIAKVKTKADGDKQKESQLLMELYKEKEISPFASLLPLLIQLPLLFALFYVLRDILKASELTKLTYEGLRHMPFVAQLVSGAVPLKTSMFGLINLAKPSPVFAVLAGLLQYVQTRQIMPRQTTPGGPPNPMAATAYIFPVVTFFFGLSLPAALALYWSTTSVIAVGQQHLVLQRGEKELEAKNGKGKK
jgi:YidC/Oxa1 family membrane protein insertase